jgi:hypothetical protein
MPHTVLHNRNILAYNTLILNSSIEFTSDPLSTSFMEGTFFYQHDHASSTPMIIPTEENQVNIEEFMRADLFDSPPPYCDLFEAIAPYHNIASSDQASNTVLDVMSYSSSSMVYNGSQIGVNDYSPNSKRTRAENGSSHSSSCLTSSEAKVINYVIFQIMITN